MLNEAASPSIAGPAGESPARHPHPIAILSTGIVSCRRSTPNRWANTSSRPTACGWSATSAHRDELWDQCYRDLMARVQLRLGQEVHRLGGDYAHVLDETIGSKHDYHSGEVWLHARVDVGCSGLRKER